MAHKPIREAEENRPAYRLIQVASTASAVVEGPSDLRRRVTARPA